MIKQKWIVFYYKTSTLEKKDNMNTKLVTFLYFGVHNFPFYGHRDGARWDRYTNSLVQISKTGLPIVCYIGSKNYEAVKNILEENNVSNVELKIRELEDIKHSKDMIKIKEKYPEEFKFYLEIGWAKIALMEEEMEEGLDYLYWIDCGLSHSGLYPLKYNSRRDEFNGLSRTKARYTFDGIFNTDLFPYINKWLGDKLLDIRNTLFFHDHRKLNEVLELSHGYDSLTVGGLIGGHTSKLPRFYESFEKYAQVSLRKEFLLNHEAMMSAINKDNSEDHKVYKFNTWYHEDTDMKSITPEFLKDKISFYTFFEEIKK